MSKFAGAKKIHNFVTMDVDKVKYWAEISDYDLDTAEAMFQTKRWLYVGFMCHQTIEKIFKAYWCSKIEGISPMSHNLINIAQSCGLNALMSEEQKLFISEIMPLNIESRYPSYKRTIAEGLSEGKCRELIDNTKSLQTWIKGLL